MAEKIKGSYRELITIGIAKSEEEIEALAARGHEWIEREKDRRHPRLDLFGEELEECERERRNAETFLSNITNITIDGADLILDRVFDNVGFKRIEYEIFRKFIKARLSYPASKSATVEYLKNHFDEDVTNTTVSVYPAPNWDCTTNSHTEIFASYSAAWMPTVQFPPNRELSSSATSPISL